MQYTHRWLPVTHSGFPVLNLFIQIFLLKMKATYAVILCFVHVAGKLYLILTYIDLINCILQKKNISSLKHDVDFYQIVTNIRFPSTIVSKDGCSAEDFSRDVENAFVSCTTNISCDAKCYRGYIFPTGSWEEAYDCQNGVWKPLLLSCKRKLFAVRQFI